MTIEERVKAELLLARHDELIPQLVTLTAEYPLRERFHAQLMLALYRAGRQAEALGVFCALRRRLVGELGVEPADGLQQVYRMILNHDPHLDLDVASPGIAEVVSSSAR